MTVLLLIIHLLFTTVIFFAGFFVNLFFQKKKFLIKEQEIENILLEKKDLEIELTKINIEKNLLLQDIENKKETITETVKNLCNEFGKISKDELILNNKESNEYLKLLLEPLNIDIKDLKEKIVRNETKIESIDNTYNKVKNLTENFVNAMKGNITKAGAWGEYVLERCLQAAGLEKDVHYVLQPSIMSSNTASRPDAVIFLPEKKAIVVDAKMSLADYKILCEDGFNKDCDKDLLNKFLKSIKDHIKSLKNREYNKIKMKEHSFMDFVFMFIPIESAFIVLAKNGLWDEAIKERIVIVSVHNFIIASNLIYLLWRSEKQDRYAKEIAQSATSLYEKFVNICDSWRKLGDALNKAQKQYNETTLMLKGRNGLYSKIKNLEEKGVGNKILENHEPKTLLINEEEEKYLIDYQ